MDRPAAATVTRRLAVGDAYRSLIDSDDPAAAHLADAIDLRPEGGRRGVGRIVVISGPEDLRELRTAVEALTGAGTWPFATTEPTTGGLHLTSTIELNHIRPVLSFVAALEGRIEDRAGAWRTWRTVVDSLATALPTPLRLTVEAIVVPGELVA